MENKSVKNSSLIIGFFVALIFLAATAFVYKIIFIDTNKIENTASSEIKIKEKSYEEVTTPKNYGTPVSTSEEGFGRINPFALY